ncbi:hypothetical protein RSOL_474740 [Rhizoctonia solani AG-3 Rhs1AP]|uniref:ICE-like protease (Caspase) p20 domain protein n=1 Tax=Rhizoctonia solani AG-3 Rhs1AP TaxID=1086054 RepID=X8JT44_9AGAM|nr:hypothetical protein RSOL_474740 [Rhizoctonia solani AG-3 Rhs1AP]
MFRFLSPKNSNTNKGSGEGPRPARGLKSGVVAWQPGSSGTFGSLGNAQTRGRSSVVQDISGTHPNVLLGFPLTEEPCSVAGADGGNIRRGRRSPAEAAASIASSRMQALALQQYGLVVTEKPKPDEFLQPTSVAKVEVGEDVAKAVPHEGAWEGLPRVYARRRLRRNQSPRFPLQTGTDPPCLSNLANVERTQPSRRSSVYENQVAPPRASKTPLKATLFNGSRNLFSASPIPPITSTLHILAIDVAYDNLQDPQHDLNILASLFKGHESGKTRLRRISGNGATLETIEATIGELYRETLKSSSSSLLILLTGEGNQDNKMYLMGDVFITDDDLRRWMWKLQIDCYPNNRTVTIILDYCRKNPDIPFGKSHFGVEFIWSCSPGQTAAALRFPSTQDMPRSCFLLSLMMSSYQFTHAKRDLTAAVDNELRRLLRLLELTHRKIHENGRCEPCNRKEECPIPYQPQDPDWQQAGSMGSVYDLVDRLSMTDIVPKVYQWFMRYRYFREANGLELPIECVDFNPMPSHQAASTQHSRGSSKPVHAAPNVQTDLRRLPEGGGLFKGQGRWY